MRLRIAAVAARLGIGASRVRQLDAQLRPRRDEAGQRRYTMQAVERVEAERRAAAARLSEARAQRAHELAGEPGGRFRGQ